MKREILTQKQFPQFDLKSGVVLNNLGSISTVPMGYMSREPKMEYRYFDAEPLKLELGSETSRAQFEAELRREPVSRKRDIRPELIAALYGEPSDWHFVKCNFTPSFVIFYLANRERLEQSYPTDEALNSADFGARVWLQDYENGFVELCIPIYESPIEALDALEFTISVAAEGTYQSLQAFAFNRHSLIETKPADASSESDLYYLSYEAQQIEDAKHMCDDMEEGH